MLNGIIVIDKPAGMTSFDVVYQLRKILHIKKIGHAGTLDPDVSGVLPIAIGQATKLIETLHERPKQYIGTGRIGMQSDTGDISGEIIQQKPVIAPLSAAEISAAMANLTGEIMQVPPMYSAVKINGKKLYEYARNHETVEVPARPITVYQYSLVGAPRYDADQQTVDFDFNIQSSKGAYVRTLVEQLAAELNYPGVMVKLRRIKSAGFSDLQTVTIEDVQQNLATPEKFLLPLETIFTDLTQWQLSDTEFAKVKNGVKLPLPLDVAEVALSYQNKIKAIYQKDTANIYKPKLMLLAND